MPTQPDVGAAAALSAAALHVSRVRALEKHAADLQAPEFWRALNPELTVSAGRMSTTASNARRRATGRDLAMLREEGYCQLAPAADDAPVVAALAAAVRRIVALDLPANFVWVYDEMYALFARACARLDAVLGDRPSIVPDEFYAFHVAPGDAAATRWSAFGPHRDWLCADPGVLARELPTVLTIWIPLVDVTTEDSCLYVVPAPGDASYFKDENDKSRSFRLQDIRALPARAGSVLAWTTHVVHWGSRSHARSTRARISATAYFQRGDAPARGETVPLDGPLPFSDRLRWIDRAMREAGPLGTSRTTPGAHEDATT